MVKTISQILLFSIFLSLACMIFVPVSTAKAGSLSMEKSMPMASGGMHSCCSGQTNSGSRQHKGGCLLKVDKKYNSGQNQDLLSFVVVSVTPYISLGKSSNLDENSVLWSWWNLRRYGESVLAYSNEFRSSLLLL